ncbi:hypothetical protein [Amorphus orientalis]|uniref:Zinc-ribbon domain-containing protein n=1 Tax=Amorphus orientalis TaxID=649198 RepID=A0AAE3VS89_9HYPH|nr:hypothetical protein [Amorphus orientalis]MDQ0317449.1 hypothetical protein [Amorphus orientalis]
MKTARFRCNACGEPLVRPVLSCPYCGAFRSAVPLDSAAQLEDERDTYTGEQATDDAGYDQAPDEREDDEPTDLVYVEEPEDRSSDPDGPIPLAVPVDEPAPAPAPEPAAATGDLSGVRGRRADPDIDAAPRVERTPKPAPEPAGRRIEPTLGSAEPAARRVGAPDVRVPGAPRPEPAAPEPAAADPHADADAAPAAPLPDPEREPRRGRRRRASAQRRVAPSPPAPGPVADHDETYEEDDGEEQGSDRSSIDAFMLETEERPRERRRRGWGGLIALAIILLLLVGGGGAAYYWLESRGVIEALRGSATMQVTRLGEPQSVSVPTSWTGVPDPASGGAVGVLIDGDGPFRLRVDGTVYTLDSGEPVRVPVREGTELEVRGLGGPVTLQVTRLGEEAAPQ